jgi:GMP synthase (glutamine-hydrolysing)
VTRALVLTHHDLEGPDALAEWLPAAGLELDELRLHAGDPVPPTLGDAVALVVMGGPQAAYDDAVPFLAAELALIRRAVASGAPVLGICLGAQLLARAAGGRVAPAARPEVGAGLVVKRDAAVSDQLFGPLPFMPDVIQFHGDEVVDLPPGAMLLAAGTSTEVQAFRVGPRAYGLQFHIESGPATVAAWARDSALVPRAGTDAAAVVASVEQRWNDVAEVWQPAVSRFASLATGGLVGRDLLA